MPPTRPIQTQLEVSARVISLMATLWLMGLSAALGLWWSLAGGLLVAITSGVAWWVGRGLHQPVLSMHLILGSVLVGVAMGVLGERPTDVSFVAWEVPIPVLATLLMGRREGMAWAVITVLGMVAVPLLLPLGLITPIEVKNPEWFQTVRMISLMVVLLAYAAIYRKRNEGLVAKVHTAMQAKTHFLANISHEIRTPLNGVLGMTEVMLLDEDRPARREQLELIARSGHLLRALIDDLLDLTKAERDITFEQTAFSLKQVLDDAVGLVASQTPELVKVSVRYESSITTVLGDPLRVRQIIGNLLSNAAKFTARGEIRLIASYDETTEVWQLRVEDTGIGMAPEVMARIFEPFRQADPSTARKFGGTGLGLALVNAYVTKMGGRVEVTSTLNRGSQFTVHLRLPPATLEVSSDPGGAPVTSPKLKALVADDNVINQLITRALLESIGCEVVTAADGEEAVTRAGLPFDIIFMDCQMPRVDGLEATRRIRKEGPNQQTPIIALTASAMAADIEETLSAGMNAVLPKPITRAAIVQTLSRFSRKPPITAVD